MLGISLEPLVGTAAESFGSPCPPAPHKSHPQTQHLSISRAAPHPRPPHTGCARMAEPSSPCPPPPHHPPPPAGLLPSLEVRHQPRSDTQPGRASPLPVLAPALKKHKGEGGEQASHACTWLSRLGAVPEPNPLPFKASFQQHPQHFELPESLPHRVHGAPAHCRIPSRELSVPLGIASTPLSTGLFVSAPPITPFVCFLLF